MRKSLFAALVLLAVPAAAQPLPPPAAEPPLPPPAAEPPLPPYGSIEVVIDRQLNVPPANAWERLIHVESWWSSSHTYSGSAVNLRLDPRAGGCWCESWDGGSVEHGRVLAAMPGKLLRVAGGFGPLQALPVVAVMTFTLTPSADGQATRLSVRYRVAGPVGELGPPVTAVLGEQIEALVAMVNTPQE